MGLRFERIVNADDPKYENIKEHNIETPHVWIFNKNTNSYYTSPELDQEITDFFKSIKNPSASSPFINFCRAVDHLEGEGSPGPVDAPQSVLDFAGLPLPVEAGPANDAGLPGVGGPVIDLASPLDPFSSIHPIIPLALGLGLFLVLVFYFLRNFIGKPAGTIKS